MNIPPVPSEIFNRHDWTIPAADFGEWAMDAFVTGSGELVNEDHGHLSSARMGWLWTTATNAKNGLRVAGTAEIPKPMSGNKWQRARVLQQFTEWFGMDAKWLDFVITLDASYCSSVGPLEVCALVEHELYHCGQAKDMFDSPKFNSDTGRPIYAIRGHDVEEFIGVVKRYGTSPRNVAELVEAGTQEPKFGQVELKRICGVCVR